MRARRKLFVTLSELRGMAGQAGETNVTSHGIALTVAFAALFAAICSIYRLNAICKIIVFFAGITALPLVLFYHYYQKKENIRFNQVDIYIHQMAYSFQRNPKIITALKDTYSIAEGNLKEAVLKAAARMESEDGTYVYKEALKIIEDEYPCDRVYTLHRFLISVEERGGDYSQPLTILLEDFDRWVRRVYKYQEDMRHVKISSSVGIILSCLIASLSVMISTILADSSVDMDITGLFLYQAETLVFLLINIIYFAYTSIHYSKDWITPVRNDSAVMKDYRLAFEKEPRQVFKVRVALLLLFAVAALVLFKICGAAAAVSALIFGVIMYFMPALNKKMAQARLKDDVYSGFSEWLREVAINLSHAPLQAAIQESYANCPAVIKPSLARFIYELDENPADVTPYYTFLKEFKILDISSTVKTLYSVTENETRNMSEVISGLISRKYELVDKHEAERNRNNLSMLRFAEYMPLMAVSVKIGMDMMLVISNYLSF